MKSEREIHCKNCGASEIDSLNQTQNNINAHTNSLIDDYAKIIFTPWFLGGWIWFIVGSVLMYFGFYAVIYAIAIFSLPPDVIVFSKGLFLVFMIVQFIYWCWNFNELETEKQYRQRNIESNKQSKK
jgi:hypothetical protein